MTKTFLTEYKESGKWYAGQNIEANSWEDAKKIAQLRGKNEIVVGILIYECLVQNWSKIN